MDVEVTKSDLRTLVGKSTRSNKFNAIKNALARDIIGYLNKAEYLGWRTVMEGKHPEAAYFAYYSRELGARTILCMRKLSDGGIYKPYAIISAQSIIIGGNYILICIKCLPLPHGRQRIAYAGPHGATQGCT